MIGANPGGVEARRNAVATAISSQVQTYQIYVNGEWRDASSGETFPSINPSNEEEVARVARGTREDAQAAIRAARESFDRGDWAAKSFKQRSEIMLKALKHVTEKCQEDDWATLESTDAGCT